MAASRFVVKDSGQINILKRLNISLEVGVLPEDAHEPHQKGPLTVGEVAVINEFGSTMANIPARKWFRGWIGRHASGVRSQIRQQLTDMVRKQKFEQEPFQVIAQRAQATMKGRIAAGQITPKNAATTLAHKSPENRPLIDSGQFLRSIHAKVSGRGLLRGWKFTTRGAGGSGK